ncbi:hypothetical protein RJT34_23910 [Clitoria ternatea]|uniref:Uncharacterized protein n=1 Tax=Clitoria ternatea TaxID=43366 RepID=A0AAN9FPQ8_CLITE
MVVGKVSEDRKQAIVEHILGMKETLVGSFDEGFGPAGRLGLEGSPADSLISEQGRKLAYRYFEYQVGALTLLSLSAKRVSTRSYALKGEAKTESYLFASGIVEVLPKTCSREVQVLLQSEVSDVKVWSWNASSFRAKKGILVFSIGLLRPS